MRRACPTNLFTCYCCCCRPAVPHPLHTAPPPLPHDQLSHTVNKGDRIAQLVLECIKTPPVEVVEDLDDTDRGAGGFGSTGGYTGITGAQ